MCVYIYIPVKPYDHKVLVVCVNDHFSAKRPFLPGWPKFETHGETKWPRVRKEVREITNLIDQKLHEPKTTCIQPSFACHPLPAKLCPEKVPLTWFHSLFFYTADKSIRRGIAQCQVKRTLGPRWSWQRAQPWEILVGSENMWWMNTTKIIYYFNINIIYAALLAWL